MINWDNARCWVISLCKPLGEIAVDEIWIKLHLTKVSLVQSVNLIWKTISVWRQEISNNVVCATSKASDQPAHKCSLIRAFASCLNILSVKLLTEHHLEFLSLKRGYTGWSESTLVKMPHYWKSIVTAHFISDVFALKLGLVVRGG